MKIDTSKQFQSNESLKCMLASQTVIQTLSSGVEWASAYDITNSATTTPTAPISAMNLIAVI